MAFVSRHFVYAQSRMQARVGKLPSAADWLSLHPIKGLAAYLDSARRGPLGAWLEGLTVKSSAHQIERQLRTGFMAWVSELGEWMPEPWEAGVRWVRHLPYLALFSHLLRGQPVYPWMREDAVLVPYRVADPSARRQRFVQSEWGAELAGTEAVSDLRQAWLTGWRKRWPDSNPRELAPLEGLGPRLLQAAGFPHGTALDEQGQRQDALYGELRLSFHRHLLHPAAAFAYLGLVAVDLHRLRADLVRRTLFPEPRQES